jgi:acetate kinase
MNILALNGGSSTLKYRLFRFGQDGFEEALEGGKEEHAGAEELAAAARTAIDRCRQHGIAAVGQRIVHGGPAFSQTARVTPDLLETLRGLRPFDPLHNPADVALLEATRELLPDVPAAAVFDTAFHSTLPEVAARYALPQDLTDGLHLRRYGFHGISHRFVSERLLECLGREATGTRLVTCHLGNGASLCAIRNGRSVDTSMGLTPLEGLVMGTRSGDVDPGLLLYLLREQGHSAEQVDDLLNRRSGLLGLSGSSADVRRLSQAAAAGDPAADLALDVFAYRVRKYIGAYAAALGGLDAVAFTGGIGEHSADVRLRVCAGLEFLGIRLDPAVNAAASGGSMPSRIAVSATEVWVVPTDEERQIARETRALLRL